LPDQENIGLKPPTSEKTVKGNQGKTLKTSTWQLHFTSNETYKTNRPFLARSA